MQEDENGRLYLTGFHGEVWQDMAKKLGFKYSVVVSDQYGAKDESGNWSGMIGMVHRNEADIAIADFLMNKERYQAVDFITSFNTDKSVFVILLFSLVAANEHFFLF